MGTAVGRCNQRPPINGGQILQTGGYVGGVTPQRRQCRRAIRARFRCASSQSRWILGSPFFLPSIYPLGAIPGHCGPAPPCYSPYKSVGTRSGGAEAPQAMCLLIWGGAPQAGSHCNVLVKGFRLRFRESQTESQSNASFHKSIFARRATSVYLHTLRFESLELSRLQTTTMATNAHHSVRQGWPTHR